MTNNKHIMLVTINAHVTHAVSQTYTHMHTHCNQNVCSHTDIKVLMSLGFFYCFTLYNLNSNTRELDL